MRARRPASVASATPVRLGASHTRLARRHQRTSCADQRIAARVGATVPPRIRMSPTWRPATADDIELIHVMVLAADRVDHPTWVTARDEIEEIFDSSSTTRRATRCSGSTPTGPCGRRGRGFCTRRATCT